MSQNDDDKPFYSSSSQSNESSYETKTFFLVRIFYLPSILNSLTSSQIKKNDNVRFLTHSLNFSFLKVPSSIIFTCAPVSTPKLKLISDKESTTIGINQFLMDMTLFLSLTLQIFPKLVSLSYSTLPSLVVVVVSSSLFF
ncbi:hypothetical protein BpHYR1_044121 [Brachionus plicatilis]|uniref:Uncharacterized protein n=1 Tax=Brachionus plicatilis TaxID=10195 RepID=A0A3M7SWC7_BRAPC|nr:hypothetical protein BpHYR1_044121 [Brachionus plicatilis]